MKKALFILILFFLLPGFVSATAPNVEHPTNDGSSLEEVGFKFSKDSKLPKLGLEKAKNPIKAIDSVLLTYIINPIFFLSGGVAVILIMYSSFRIITARGEEEGITAAKKSLTWSFVGLALVILSYTLVSNMVRIVLSQL